jgi:hypothetical protein
MNKSAFFIFQENIKSGSKAKSNRGYITTPVKGHKIPDNTVWLSSLVFIVALYL